MYQWQVELQPGAKEAEGVITVENPEAEDFKCLDPEVDGEHQTRTGDPAKLTPQMILAQQQARFLVLVGDPWVVVREEVFYLEGVNLQRHPKKELHCSRELPKEEDNNSKMILQCNGDAKNKTHKKFGIV